MASKSDLTLQPGAARFVSANPLTVASLSTPERLAEIAKILAAGLMRLRARQSTPLSPARGESSLDIPPDQSGHPTPKDRRMSDG